MKKIFTIAAIAAATFFATSCAKEIEGGLHLQNEGIIAQASLQPLVVTKAIGQYSYNVVWETEDRITVLDKSGNKASFKLKDGAGSTSGTFQQEGTDALTAPLAAYYPASVVTQDGTLEWPALQPDVRDIADTPMTADSPTAKGEVNFAFKHLGAILQLFLTAKNGTIDIKQIDITADQGLSGAFTISDGKAGISNTGTTITTGDISSQNIKLSATTTYLNFAVPAGDFTNFKITITDVNGKEYSLSAARLTIQRAMVNKVTFAMDAKSDAIYELNVNGHTVTVKMAEDVIAHDVFFDACVADNSVIVNAWSKSSKHLKCTMPDGEFCTSQSQEQGPVIYNYLGIATGYQYYIFSFIISDISESTTATIGYANPVSSIAISPAGADCRVTVVGGDLYEGEVVRLVPNATYSYGISSWNNQNDNVLCDGYDYTVRLSQDVQITACFKENLILDGIFTVDSSGKKVRFTRGNLCGGHMVERRQYDFAKKFDEKFRYFSHFFWCDDYANAFKKKYNTYYDGQSTFFTEKEDFSLVGLSEIKCFVLPDWKFLIDSRTGISTVNGTENARFFLGCVQTEVDGVINGLFIFPDSFTWPASVETLPKGINDASTGYDTNTYTYNDFKRLQDAGIVFLPACGFRAGSPNQTYPERILSINQTGFYWSSSCHNGTKYAYGLSFETGGYASSWERERAFAGAVRLVTKVTE